MSYKSVPTKEIEGIRKVRWDGLWHVMYENKSGKTYDRVDKTTAMNILRQLEYSKKKQILVEL